MSQTNTKSAQSTTTVTTKTPRKKKDNTYFGKVEEDAVVEYLSSDDPVRKEQLFNEILSPAFNKMVEAIIRRYKLFIPNEEFDDIFGDALSFLITKLDKFKPGRKKKAYSYYGTITKHYLIARIEKYTQMQQKCPSYDGVDYDFTNSLKYADIDDKGARTARECVDAMVAHIDDMLTSPEEYPLTDDETLVGKALKNLLENWDYVLSTDDSRKFNKNVVRLFIREQTHLDSKRAREATKIFIDEYPAVKAMVIR